MIPFFHNSSPFQNILICAASDRRSENILHSPHLKWQLAAASRLFQNLLQLCISIRQPHLLYSQTPLNHRSSSSYISDLHSSLSTEMALSSFFGRRSNVWDMPDPMDVIVPLFENEPASELARDARAMASTSVDWKETATEHVFKADLPGLRKEDVQVHIEDDRTLSISGQRKKEEVHKTDTWHRVERSSGHFMRKFRLPEDANLDRITAKVDSGVLTVMVPKLEEKKETTRTIEIRGSKL